MTDILVGALVILLVLAGLGLAGHKLMQDLFPVSDESEV